MTKHGNVVESGPPGTYSIRQFYKKGIIENSGFGRHYADAPSMQRLCKSARAAACNSDFIELDMKTAHW